MRRDFGFNQWFLKRAGPGIIGSALVLMPHASAVELTVNTVQDLSFGSFAAVNGGTVTIGTFSGRSSTGTVWLNPSGNGNAALFTVAGDPDTSFSVLLPANDTVFLSGPGTTMAINDFTSEPSGVSGRLDTLGTGTVRIGATLTVAPGQTPGAYIGSFFITVNYN